ncbi:integrase [Micromonospora sp. NPDC007208]|uniref:integrase n=1 Tax=Micromonospora sp. NPDC007208 TaxID=3364236 RepID=UPI00367E3944
MKNSSPRTTHPTPLRHQRRPLKQAPPPAARPVSAWLQPVLLPPGPRDYLNAVVDLRTGPPPDNPWLAWALHLTHSIAETRGWRPTAQRAMQRVLVRLLADHREPDLIRATDLGALTAQYFINLDHVVEILATMDVLDDDRPPALESLMAAKVAGLPDPWRRDLLTWARLLRDGGPRSRARDEQTVRAYLGVAANAAATWPQHGHLREVVRDDVLAYLGTLRGTRREIAATALRALFRWAKSHKLIFRNPTHGISIPAVPDPIWQPLRPEEITASVAAATTPQARLYVILAAVHAARPGQIRALHLDDVDLATRRITIGGNSRLLDELTTHALLDWLAHRRERWPGTANPHLLVSSTSALGHAPVSHTWILNLRGLPGTLERLRIDRQLEEAITAGADPLHLAAVFGLSEGTAIRWATNARQLLTSPRAAQ